MLKEYDKMKEEIKNQKRFEESKYPKVVKTNNGRIMLLLTCEVRDSKKSKFSKEEEVSGLLGNLGVKTSSKISFVGPLLF